MPNPTAELAIRQQRALFNRAIAARDATAIGPILARDCVMMTGTDSAVISGRNAQVKVWKAMFAAGDTTVFTRTPETITLSAVEPIAFEQGQWEGRAPDAAAAESAGVYTAKWREVGGVWQIEAEIFVTLR